MTLSTPSARRPDHARHAIVVGGGWAGIAAAVELTYHGWRVDLFEGAHALGGRARTVRLEGQGIDNGQHLMLGAYRAVLALLERLSLAENQAFVRRSLRLRMVGPDGLRLALQVRGRRAPWHLLAALSRASGLGLSDRLRAATFLKALRAPPEDRADTSVAALLDAHRQPATVRTALWEPLCLAALNTHPAKASARLFVRVLREALLADAAASDLLIPRADLGSVLPQPAAAFIERNGGRLRFGRRVRALMLDEGGVHGVVLSNGTRHAGRRLVLAAGVVDAARLLRPHETLRALAAQLDELEHEPICTVYLQYPPDTTLEEPMVGLVGTLTQWVFDRGLAGQPGLMAAVISGGGPHEHLDNTALIGKVQAELATCFESWPAPRHGRVIREKRGTFAGRVGVDGLRPGPVTPVPGLYLAGDYTATGLPATLEGAVRSGRAAVGWLMAAGPDAHSA